VLPGIEFCCLCFYLTGPILAATSGDTTQVVLFEPGKEYRVLTDNEAIGKKSFNLYVPRDYTDDRVWPLSSKRTLSFRVLEGSERPGAKPARKDLPPQRGFFLTAAPSGQSRQKNA